MSEGQRENLPDKIYLQPDDTPQSDDWVWSDTPGGYGEDVAYVRLDPPVLHERTEDGGWICCCGDHLAAADMLEDGGDTLAWMVHYGCGCDIPCTTKVAGTFCPHHDEDGPVVGHTELVARASTTERLP